MTVTSVINYKDGVGKTTLTANIGAELARRGQQVLLIDLDPQASLTHSFFPGREREHQLAEESTVLQWFGSVFGDGPPDPLHRYVLTPAAVNEVIGQYGRGKLDLVASHLNLAGVDLDFAAGLTAGSRFPPGSQRHLRLHRALADALAAPDFQTYDTILVDCAPNLTMVTRSGIVASDHVLIPARPDYLSTLGIGHLRRGIFQLVRDCNRATGETAAKTDPKLLGVVLTMVRYDSSGPIAAQRDYTRQPSLNGVPVFRRMIRQDRTWSGPADEDGVPAVLAPNASPTVSQELRELASEFLAKTRV